MPSAYSRFRHNISYNQERINNIYNRFVEDTMEDIIKSLNYVVTKTRTSVSSHFSKSNGAGSKSGECRECNRPGPKHWCIPHETRRFQRKWKKWTSGNEDLNEYIRQTQLAASSPTDYLEWIPYEKLDGIKEVGKGGLGPVYQAEWIDGPKFQWKEKSRRWVRQGRTRVALKCLQNSGKATTEFLNELKEHHRCVIEDHVPQCYGITRKPDADCGDYMIVMQYANEGSLRDYLSSNRTEIGWLEKLKILKDIADGLQMIHNRVLIHRNLHPGNLLRHIDEKTKQGCTLIADLGLSRPLVNRRISSISAISGDPNKPKVYGVLPYVAPEVMRGEGYSKAADVYSLGVVMWELASGQKPFPNRPHNFHLALDICNGLRPAISNTATTPKCYIDLVGKCWDAHPGQRPDVSELRTIFERWLGELQENSPGEFGELAKQEKEKESSSSPSVQPSTKNSQAIYISRLLNFADLPKPQNSSSYEPRNYEFIEFEESEVVDGDSGKLQLFIPNTGTVKSPLVPRIPEVKVDSISMDATSDVNDDDDEQSSY